MMRRFFCVLIAYLFTLLRVNGYQPIQNRGGSKSLLRLWAKKPKNIEKQSLIVGVNKYSHDTSCCIVNGNTGEILFAQAKERITSTKHDGGGINQLLQLGLKSIGGKLEEIEMIVQNNHHYRIHPFEKRLPFASSIHYVPKSYQSDYNLVPKAKHYEISHHLAHAWSGLATAPFSNGLIVVMDGMGESYKAMIEDIRGTERYSGDYLHDLKLLRLYGTEKFIGQPVSLFPGSTYREAETAYLFNSQESKIQPVFKRWSREQSPPELYNHGFENMESIGAIYSRISSHILGDWNACGKVMGLASWANRQRKEADDWYYSTKEPIQQLSLGKQFHHPYTFMKGNPVLGTFEIDWELLDHLSNVNAFSAKEFDYYANIAASIQQNLNEVTIDMLSSLQQQTQAKNLIFVGGVALNSILNQKILESKLFDQVYIPSAPGDEGIAIGCALYGFQRKQEEELLLKEKNEKETALKENKGQTILNGAQNKVGEEKNEKCSNPEPCDDPKECSSKKGGADDCHDYNHSHSHDHDTETKVIPFHQQSLSPYSGLVITNDMIETAIEDYESYLNVEKFATNEELIEDASQVLAEGKVIAWFQGKSEFGQRALGHRSIIGNPSFPQLRKFINEKIKFREWYRPLAPSILAEHVADWFEIPSSSSEGKPVNLNFSPYMSYTAKLLSSKVSQVPSVSHIDQTARLQTVDKEESPLYYQLIERFYHKTKIPMILNTSLNKKSQPIIETPLEAIQFILSLQGNLHALYLQNYKIILKPFPFNEKKEEKIAEVQTTEQQSSEDSSGSDEPNEMERDLLIKGKLLYLSELTFVGQAAKSQRARIQDNLLLLDPFEQYGITASSLSSDDAHNDNDHDELGKNSNEQKKWRELPSDLHLEILQLLQEIPGMSDHDHDHDHDHEHSPDDNHDDGEGSGENDEKERHTSSTDCEKCNIPENAITIDELYYYLQQLRQSSPSIIGEGKAANAEEDEEESELSWSKVKTALKWLYYEGLVEFPEVKNVSNLAEKDADAETDEDGEGDAIKVEEGGELITDVSNLFPGVKIKDFRSLG